MTSRRWSQLQGGTPREVGRLVYRKAIHRHTLLGRWGVRAGDTVPPPGRSRFAVEIVDPSGFDEVAEHNPHLDDDALAHLRRQDSTCIIARDDRTIAASTWMTRGDVYVHDLQRFLHVPADEHFSCRSYVADDYRGAALMNHLVAVYSRHVAAQDDTVWGLIFPWNTASVRVFEKLGWRRTGDEWTRWVFDRPVAGSRSYPPRPPLPRRPVVASPANGGRAALPPCLLLTEEVWGGTLHAMRSLDAMGVPVLVASTGSGAAVFGRSRACTAAKDFDPTDPEEFCTRVSTWARGFDDGLAPVPVIATSDRLVDVLDRGRHQLRAPLRPLLPDPASLNELLDKARAAELAADARLDVLPWVEVARRDDLRRAAVLPLPVIVRPSRWDSGGERYAKLVVCHSNRQRDETLEQLLDEGGTAVVQEYLDVSDDAVEVGITWRSQDGTVTTTATGRKRRQAGRDGGVMAWGEAVDLPDVRAATERFLDRSGFTGLGGIEFIRTDGRLWFVEFNPRLEAIHFLATAAGIDTVALAYQDSALDQRSSVPVHQHPAAAWVGSAWLARLRANPGAWREAVDDRRSFAGAPNGTRAIWTRRDPGPGLAVTARLVRQALARRPVRP
ncbi:hypothetical protein BH23ACT2_BH23ACT2_24970 [soil metagenome]